MISEYLCIRIVLKQTSQSLVLLVTLKEVLFSYCKYNYANLMEDELSELIGELGSDPSVNKTNGRLSTNVWAQMPPLMITRCNG